MKEIVEEIKNKDIEKFCFDKMCYTWAQVVRNDLKNENLLFVFDNLEDFDLIKIIHAKLKDVNNIEMLITTKDNSFKDKLSKYKFAEFRIDFFNQAQAQKYFHKSLKEDVEERDKIIKRVLESEMQYAFFIDQSKCEILAS